MEFFCLYKDNLLYYDYPLHKCIFEIFEFKFIVILLMKMCAPMPVILFMHKLLFFPFSFPFNVTCYCVREAKCIAAEQSLGLV